VRVEKLKYNKLPGSFLEGKLMRPRLKAKLSEQEDKMLFELRKSPSVPQRVKDRAQVIRLSHEGWFVEKIAAFFGWNVQTVRGTLHRWRKDGLEGLKDARGRGQKARWNESDMEFLERCLEEPRSYNRKQLAKKLADERGIHLSPGHLRDVLKKRGLFGNERVKVTKTIKTL
jgi:transposase